MHKDMSNLKLTTTHHHIHRDSIQWEPPPEGFVKLNVDVVVVQLMILVLVVPLWQVDYWVFFYEGKGDALFVELFGVYKWASLGSK